MTLKFTVYGAIFGKNQGRGVNFARRTLYVPAEVKKWQRNVGIAAWFAAGDQNWPDPFLVRQAGVRIVRYNLAGDGDRGDTFVWDALQFRRWPTPRGSDGLPYPIGIIDNDRGFFSEGSPPTREDFYGPRMEVEVRLTALRSPAEAARLRERWFERELRRKSLLKALKASKRNEKELAEIAHRTGVSMS